MACAHCRWPRHIYSNMRMRCGKYMTMLIINRFGKIYILIGELMWCVLSGHIYPVTACPDWHSFNVRWMFFCFVLSLDTIS